MTTDSFWFRIRRVSSFDQDPERQLEHVRVDRLFTDKACGKERGHKHSLRLDMIAPNPFYVKTRVK